MAQAVIFNSPRQCALTKALIDRAPIGAVVTVKEAARSVGQNALLWALLSDISRAKPEGRLWAPEVWKDALMSALSHEILWQPGIDGNPPFPAGFRSSRLNQAQFGDLITMVQEYGDRHGVRGAMEWKHETSAVLPCDVPADLSGWRVRVAGAEPYSMD